MNMKTYSLGAAGKSSKGEKQPVSCIDFMLEKRNGRITRPYSLALLEEKSEQRLQI